MEKRKQVAIVAASIATLVSACIAGTDPDAVSTLASTGRRNALEAQARVEAMGLSPSHRAPNGESGASKLEVDGSGPDHAGWMAYVANAKAGDHALQAAAEAYIIGGSPPAQITIKVDGAFENADGFTPINTTVRGTGAARFFKAWASSCYQHVRSSVNVHGLFSAAYPRTTWGPVDDEDSKACWTEDNCDNAVTRKSGRANFDSGICDSDAPIYGSAGGDAPLDNPTVPNMNCYWYRDVLIIWDPDTGDLMAALWLGDWKHQCDEMTVASGENGPSSRIPVVLRARGPLGTTARHTMLIAEAGDTVSIAIDTTRATGADVDAALARAATMWKVKGEARENGVVATTMAPAAGDSKDNGSRGAELLRAVKREASHHVRDRGRARELTTTVERRP